MPRSQPEHHGELQRLARTLRWIGVALALSVASQAIHFARGQQQGDLAARVSSWIDQLDSDQFRVRQRAARELEELIKDSASAEVVARGIQQALAGPPLSFEVRKQLESWLPRLPEIPSQQPAPSPDEDLSRLILELEADSYATRLAAQRRLQSLAEDPMQAARLAHLLRDRLAEPKLSSDSYQKLAALWDKARGTWLLSDPRTWNLPPPGEAEIDRAVAALTRPAASDAHAPSPEHQAARRQLLDMLAYDEAVPRIKKAIETALAAEGIKDESRQRLESILELTIPALVAEIWQSGENALVQYLYVDVPQQVAGAERASHFSRIDDETAVCKSGNNLEPGEYPVGVAIPHAAGKDWICHLVNLPNPRRRQAYDYRLQVDERIRLAELTERTLRHLTGKRLPMSDQLFGLIMLGLQNRRNVLDRDVLSEHIGSYLMTVQDRALEEGADIAGGPAATHHQRICFMLALLGTKSAGPGLVRVIEAQRCRPASFETTPYHWPQIAALTIAARDPWRDAELWLASQISSDDPLVIISPGGDEDDGPPTETALPQLGAGAAALLLKQHDMALGSFGLIPVRAKPLENLGCPCYRFASPEDQQRVLAWWNQIQQQRQRQQAP